MGVSAAAIKMPSEATLTVQHDWPAPSCICCSRLQEDVSDSAARAPEVPAGDQARGPPLIHFICKCKYHLQTTHSGRAGLLIIASIHRMIFILVLVCAVDGKKMKQLDFSSPCAIETTMPAPRDRVLHRSLHDQNAR